MLGVSKAAISHEDDDGGERSHDASARSIASRTSGCRSSRVISARAVERVVGISRKAVDAYVTAIAAKLDLPLRRVVARLAQALQFAGAERRPVALVRLDMIDHRRSLNETALQTKLAQWVLSQLKPAQTLPARGLVEIRPRNRIAANSHHAAPPCPRSADQSRGIERPELCRRCRSETHNQRHRAVDAVRRLALVRCAVAGRIGANRGMRHAH